MPVSLIKLSFINYYYQLDSLLYLLGRINSSTIFNIEEKKKLNELFVARVCAEWERLLDIIFVHCFSLDSSKFSELTKNKLPKRLNFEIAQAIIIGDEYLDFRDFGDIKKYAKKKLTDRNNPFLNFQNNRYPHKLDEFYTIRNYLSHYSDISKRKLHKMYKDKRYYKKQFKEPGHFLYSKVKLTAVRHRIYRILDYISEFKNTALDIQNFMGIRL